MAKNNRNQNRNKGSSQPASNNNKSDDKIIKNIPTNATPSKFTADSITKELLQEMIDAKCGIVADIARGFGIPNDRKAIYRKLDEFELHDYLKEARKYIIDICKSNMFALACGEIKTVNPITGNVYKIPPSESANKFFIQSLDEDYTPKVKNQLSGTLTVKDAIAELSDEQLDRLQQEIDN